MKSPNLVLFIALIAVLASPCSAIAQPADWILTGARVWTGDPEHPNAKAVAVAGDRILAVGSSEDVSKHRGPDTRIVALDGAFVAPGFIDNHTHFNRAGELLLGVNLLDVADAEGLKRRVTEARNRLPKGAWMVGGDWGAYEAWGQNSTGREATENEAASAPFSPDRLLLDPLTPDHPALLSKWDRSAYLANSLALEAADASCDWEGVECREGQPTGRLSPEAAERVRTAIPPKPMEQRLAEARVALARLASHGVTSFHDITPPEQLAAYQELKRGGELTARVYARPTLDRVEHLAALGIRHGFGDEWVKIGGLKGFVDGIMGNSTARFYEPQLHSGERGSWRAMMSPPGNMERLVRLADANGHQPQVHAIGDEAIDTLLDIFEKVMTDHGPKPEGQERRWRVIHTQVIRGPEVAERMARLGLIAEVQPYHCIDDMRWMEERIGERSRWAYAFKTLQDAGVRLSFGSDWPGTNASWYPASPVLGIYAAVTRKTLDGTPGGGWFPEERVDVETALRAYTVNNAWAAGEEAIKGSITPGKLADLVVLDRDPFTVEPDALKDLKVLKTVVGGEVVFEASAPIGDSATEPMSESVSESAAASVVQGSVDQVGWLAGCWRSVGREAGSGEVWTAPAGGTMLGTGRMVRGGKTVSLEHLLIRETEDGGLEYVATPSGQRRTVFRLETIEERRVVFANPQHDFPQRILYHLRSDGVLAARIEGVVSGQERGIDFPMERSKCPASGTDGSI